LFCVTKGNNTGGRLPKALQNAGFDVSGLSPAGSLLTATHHLERHIALRCGNRAGRLLAALERANRSLAPDVVVPVDERAIALIAHFVRREAMRPGTISPPLLACLQRSLGRLETLGQRISKSEIQKLAGSLGLRTPGQTEVATAAEAEAAAGNYGYPVVLKLSHGAGGAAVRICRDRDGLMRSFREFDRRRSSLRRRAWQKLLDLEWYGKDASICVQRHIAGRPAMTTAAAVSGRTAAILAAFAEETWGDSSPASVLRLARHDGMESASKAMIAALGATGFVSFDFVVDAKGREYLLECNARPIRATLVGPMAGLDLAAALARGLAGDVPQVAETIGSGDITVALFPQTIVHGGSDAVSDTPVDDPGLLKALMLQRERSMRKAAGRRRWRRLFSRTAPGRGREPALSPGAE
jgi:hypothetical protein